MIIRTTAVMMLAVAASTAAVTAQQAPLDRLREVLPGDVSAQVLRTIEEAQSTGLPPRAMANVALEGVAKGRSGPEVLAAVASLVADMGRAQEALRAAGHAPGEGEIEAAAAALRMGVDGAEISALARSGPSGRSLAVPLLVLGGLTQRGLASDDALATVRDRLAARADDAALLGAFDDVGRDFGLGMRPDQVGTALAGGLAGFEVPAAGMTVPVGPQQNQGRPPAGRGRGGPPGS